MQQKNFFDFATKELSHSAFWAWVLNLKNSNDDDLKKISEKVYEFFGFNDNTKTLLIKDVLREHPLDDNGRIDIFIETNLDKGFGVEVKLKAKPSLEQIKRYEEKLKKIGFIDLGYSNLHYEDIKNIGKILTADIAHETFGESFGKSDNIIIKEYGKWIKKTYERRKKYLNFLNDTLLESDISNDHKAEWQWAIMMEFQSRLKKNIKDITLNLYDGRNRNGTPWTQLRFYDFKNKNHSIFYRIDKRAKGFYFSANLYTENTEHAEEHKNLVEYFRAEFLKLDLDIPINKENLSKINNKETNLCVFYFKGYFEDKNDNNKISLNVINDNIINLTNKIISLASERLGGLKI